MKLDGSAADTAGGVVSRFTVDRELRYTSFNEAHATHMMASYGASIALGKRLPDYLTVAGDRDRATGTLERALAGERVVATAHYGEPGLERRCIELIHAPLRDAAGAVIGVEVRAHDATDRRHVEDTVLESEGVFAFVFEHSSAGMSVTLPSGEVTVNRAFCEMLGYARDELVARTWQELTHHDDVAETAEEMTRLKAGPESSTRHEKRYLKKDGAVVWADVASTLRRNDHGEPAYFVTTMLDISARKAEHEALEESERTASVLLERLNEAQRVADVGSWEWDLVTDEVWWSDETYRIFGVSPGDYVPSFEGNGAFMHPDDLEAYGTSFRHSLGTGEALDFDCRLLTGDGRLKYCNARGRTIVGDDGTPVRFIGTLMDVTQRTLAEEAAAKTGRLLDAAQALGKVGGWVYDVADDRVLWTDEVYRIYGVGPEFDVSDIVHAVAAYAPHDAPRIDAAFRKAVQAGEPYDLEVELDRADGERIWVRTIGRPESAEGAVVRVIGTIMDITERKRTEQALRESEEKYRGLFEHSKLGIAVHRIVLDEAGEPVDYVFLDANPAFEAGTGLRIADIIGKRVTEVLPGIEHSSFIETYGKVALGGDPVSFEQYAEPLGRHYAVTAYGLGEGRFATVFADITAQKQAEDTLAQVNIELERRVGERTAQLESANEELQAFAYSVSHDLRGPLRAIDGFSEILVQDYGDVLDGAAHEDLARVRAAAQHMGHLIDALLSLSRLARKELDVVDVDLSEMAADIVARLREQDPGRQVDVTIAEGCTARTDAGLVEVLLSNLIENAWKFTSARERAHITFGEQAEGEERVFTVQDDGAGFDPSYAGKLFQPFQRLHGPAEYPGTGIGLATVKRAVSRLGGRCWAKSAVGEGATFSFTLGEP